MAYVLKQFDTAQGLTDYLNGVVQGKPVSTKVLGLHGKTLKVNPAGTLRTVTFSDSSGAGLTLKEIIDQIEAVNADMVGIAAFRSYRTSSYILTFFSSGDVVDKTGTANSILGFSAAADATVGTNAVALSDIVHAHMGDGGGKFSVLHQ